MANGKTGRNDAFKRRSRSDRNLRDAIDDAIDDAMKGASGPVMSDLDQQLLNQMRDKFSGDILGEAGKTISDLDRKMVNEIVGDVPKPRMRPDVGAIERGNRAARRTAQDLSRMEDGGLAGGQKKLDKNKDGKISGEDFKILRKEKKSTKGTKVKKMQGGGQVCRGGGAAMRGTNFSGVR